MTGGEFFGLVIFFGFCYGVYKFSQHMKGSRKE